MNETDKILQALAPRPRRRWTPGGFLRGRIVCTNNYAPPPGARPVEVELPVLGLTATVFFGPAGALGCALRGRRGVYELTLCAGEQTRQTQTVKLKNNRVAESVRLDAAGLSAPELLIRCGRRAERLPLW